jgi:hypothetical protein
MVQTAAANTLSDDVVADEQATKKQLVRSDGERISQKVSE